MTITNKPSLASLMSWMSTANHLIESLDDNKDNYVWTQEQKNEIIQILAKVIKEVAIHE